MADFTGDRGTMYMKRLPKKGTLLSLFHLKCVQKIVLNREVPPTLFSARKYVYRATKNKLKQNIIFSWRNFTSNFFPAQNPKIPLVFFFFTKGIFGFWAWKIFEVKFLLEKKYFFSDFFLWLRIHIYLPKSSTSTFGSATYGYGTKNVKKWQSVTFFCNPLHFDSCS